MSDIAGVKIAVHIGDVKRGFVLEGIDFTEKRDSLALRIGRAVVDGIYEEAEK